MWRLWRDQLDRNKWKVVGFAALALCFVFSFLFVSALASDARVRRPAGGVAHFGFYWWLFWGGWVGVSLTIADRRGLRVVRALPVRSCDAARAWWMGATTTPVVMGALMYALVVVVDAFAGRTVELPIAVGDLKAPGSFAFALVWTCSTASISWGLMMPLMARDPRVAIGSVVLLFLVVGFSVVPLLSPSIFLRANAQPGGSLRDVLGLGQAVSLFIAVVLAGVSFVLSPRLVVPPSRAPAFVSSWRGTSHGRTPPGLGGEWTTVAEVLRLFAVAMAATLAGFLLTSMLPLLWGGSFRLGRAFVLLWLYLVPAFWISPWLLATRAFRCLPLSAGRLAALPVMYAAWLCLAGAGAVAVALVLTNLPTSIFTWPLWLLLLCPGLLSLFYSVTVRTGPGRSVGVLLGTWAGVLALGSWMPNLFIILGSLRGAPISVSLSGAFWPGALSGLVLACLGYLALRRTLVMDSTPYRPVPPTRPW